MNLGDVCYVDVGVWFWTAAFLLHPCKLSTHFIKPILHKLGKKQKVHQFQGLISYHHEELESLKIRVIADVFSVG